MQKVLVGAVIIVSYLLLTLGVHQVYGHGLPDQINDPQWGGGWTNIQPSNQVEQTFVPSKSVLAGIDVAIITANPGTGDDHLTMMIIDAKGNLLTSNTVYVSDGFNNWLHFDIPGGNLALEVGTIYSLRLQDTGKLTFGWKYAGNTYPYGNRVFYGNSYERHDYFFKTYSYEDTAIPTLSEWGLIIFLTIILGIGVVTLVRRRMV